MKEGRTIIFKVRLTREELQALPKKAESYGGNTSAMSAGCRPALGRQGSERASKVNEHADFFLQNFSTATILVGWKLQPKYAPGQ